MGLGDCANSNGGSDRQTPLTGKSSAEKMKPKRK